MCKSKLKIDLEKHHVNNDFSLPDKHLLPFKQLQFVLPTYFLSAVPD